jgi:hypothetical protein
MKERWNEEARIDRIVGKRVILPDGLTAQASRIRNAVAWRKAFGGVGVPKGVHRFRTHEEADSWLWKMITRPHLG